MCVGSGSIDEFRNAGNYARYGSLAAQTRHLEHRRRLGHHQSRERRIDLQGVPRGRDFPDLCELQLGARSLRQHPDEFRVAQSRMG